MTDLLTQSDAARYAVERLDIPESDIRSVRPLVRSWQWDLRLWNGRSILIPDRDLWEWKRERVAAWWERFGFKLEPWQLDLLRRMVEPGTIVLPPMAMGRTAVRDRIMVEMMAEMRTAAYAHRPFNITDVGVS